MIKNYSDHTIAIQVGGIIYFELPAGWSDTRFENDPEFEEFLKKRYPELNPPEEKTKKRSRKK